MDRWIPEVDTGTRVWKCPECGGRMGGHSMHWKDGPTFNPYYYCPYCGAHLKDEQLSMFQQGGET